jgi:aryl-alcohol dehydrogenase-like predicted oxidoreductase
MVQNQLKSMSKIALGTAQFGLAYGVANQSGQIQRNDGSAILNEALSQGIDTIDTAIAYGNSEDCLGEIGVHDFHVISKLPPVPSGVSIASWVNDQISSSLKRLRVDRLDGLLLHQPTQLLGDIGVDLFKALLQARDKGLVKKIGISIYEPSELDAILTIFSLDIIQAPLNLVDRRLVSSGWLGRLKDRGIEVHTRSAFLQGLLLMDRQLIPEYFSKWDALWDAWQADLEGSTLNALQHCLAYPLSFDGVDRVVVGVDGIDQLKEILSAAKTIDVSVIHSEIQSEDLDLINPSLWRVN